MAGAAILKPEALSNVLAVGSAPGAAVLMTSNGSLIACAGANGNEDMIASVVSNAWVTYERGASQELGPLRTLVIQCQLGRLVVSQVVSGLLLCLFSDTTIDLKVTQLRLRALRSHIEEPLATIFPKGVQGMNRSDCDDEGLGEAY
jgi:predicted regulator of Ras-like GTPase activity (Roadblock/LC7/MglB family)